MSDRICPECGQGLLVRRRCATCWETVELCDECEAMWIDDGDPTPIYPEQPDLPCPFCGTAQGYANWPALPNLIGDVSNIQKDVEERIRREKEESE